MRRTLAIITFVAVAALLYLSAFMIMGRWTTRKGSLALQTADYYMPPGRGTWYQLREYDPQQADQVVIIGSSHAYRGYDPRVFRARGHAAFNLGSPSQSPLNSYVVLDRYVNPANTSLVVFDVFHGIFRSNAMESGADHIANAPDLGSAAAMAWNLGGIPALNMLAVRATAPGQATPPPPDRFYHGMGFGAKLDSAGPNPPKPTANWNGSEEMQYRYFRKCMALCRERGVPVVVVQHYVRHQQDRAELEAFARLMQAELQPFGIHFLDFSLSPGVNDEHHFVDYGHLNLAGARLFTGQLVDSLESLGYLPHMPSPAGRPGANGPAATGGRGLGGTFTPGGY